jgi:hypothetical protein
VVKIFCWRIAFRLFQLLQRILLRHFVNRKRLRNDNQFPAFSPNAPSPGDSLRATPIERFLSCHDSGGAEQPVMNQRAVKSMQTILNPLVEAFDILPSLKGP